MEKLSLLFVKQDAPNIVFKLTDGVLLKSR